jgi:hypothetical protein
MLARLLYLYVTINTEFAVRVLEILGHGPWPLKEGDIVRTPT